MGLAFWSGRDIEVDRLIDFASADNPLSAQAKARPALRGS
jgi:hypothetical protein